MALVILNDELALFVCRDVVESLTNALAIEMQKIYAGNGSTEEITKITTEISNIARQIDEAARKHKAKQVVKF
jgi:hypothetical protein